MANKTWKEVAKNPEYQSLSDTDKYQAQQQYFEQVVAPEVPRQSKDQAWNQFSSYVKDNAIDFAKPGFLKSLGSDIGRGLTALDEDIARAGKRGLGIAYGLVSSPLTFGMAGLAASEFNEEEYNKMSLGEQLKHNFNFAANQAWKGIHQKGHMGFHYGDYYRAVRGGKSIGDDLPDKMKWAAPTLEFIANLVVDPIIGPAEVSRLMSLKTAHLGKKWKAILPPEVWKDIQKIDRGEEVVKRAFQSKLLGYMNKRKEYMQWWEAQEPVMEHAQRFRDGLRYSEEKLAAQVGKSDPTFRTGVGAKLHERPVSPIDPIRLSKAREAQKISEGKAVAEANKRNIIKRDALSDANELFKHPEPKPIVPEIKTTEPTKLIKRDITEEVGRKAGIPDRLIIDLDTVPSPKKGVSISIKKLPGSTDEIAQFNIEKAGKKVGEFRATFADEGKTAYIGWAEAEDLSRSELLSAAKQIRNEYPAVEKAVAVRSAKMMQLESGKWIEKPARQVSLTLPKAGPKGTYAKASGGAVLGIERDEDGNYHYNVEKGLAGTLLIAGGMSLKGQGKRFAKTMADNPAWAKVHGSIGAQKGSGRFVGLLGRLNLNIFDRFAPLRKISERTYEMARAYHSYKDTAKIAFDDLVQKIAPVRDQEVLFTDYVTAHRNMTRARRGFKNPGGVTLKEAQQAISEMESYWVASGRKLETLRNSMKNFQTWTHESILRPAMESGLISQETYNSIVKNNEWYAAFDVIDNLPANLHDIPAGVTGEYFSVGNQKVIQALKGTEKQITNPIEATINKFTQAQGTIARNKVASTLLDDPVAKEFLRPVAQSELEFGKMKKAGQNPIMTGQWNRAEFDTVNRFKNGVVERYIAPREIADAMKQLQPWRAEKFKWFFGSLQKSANVFRKGATAAYLPFTITNAMRDAFMAYTTAPVYRWYRPNKFAKDWAIGFWQGAKHEFLGSSDLAKEYLTHGGGFGYVGELRDLSAAKSQLFKKGMIRKAGDIIQSPITLIEKISTTVELAPRLGTFNRAKMIGIPLGDAALVAKQSTIDFNKGGVLTKVANQFIPFLNARFQSINTVAGAMNRAPGETLAKIGISTIVPGTAAYAWNRLYYSDLYDDIPEQVRRNYFVVITGTERKEGKTVPNYLVIPKGEIGQVGMNPLEFGLDNMWKKDREKTAAFLVNYLSELSPVEFSREGELSGSKAAGSIMPPVFKGLAENWANLKFYQGTEVEPYYMGKYKPPELRYKKLTPETYKWLGKKLKMSPLKLQNFASNLVAGYGREGLDPTSMLRGLTGRLVRTTVGEKEHKAWVIVADIDQGYFYTRAYAQEMVKHGDRRGAIQLMNEWDRSLSTRLKATERHGFKDKNSLNRSYRFTPNKRKELLMNIEKRGSYLERKLGITK